MDYQFKMHVFDLPLAAELIWFRGECQFWEDRGVVNLKEPTQYHITRFVHPIQIKLFP